MADHGTSPAPRMTLSPAAAASVGGAVLERLAQAEAELDRLRTALERTQRLAMLGGLAACTAHEINNLLSPVLIAAQLAAANPDDPALARKAARRAAEGAKHACDIAECILGFAATETDDEPGADVRQTIDAALRCLARDPAKDGIVLTVEAEAGLTAAISPLALQQVVLNLILNAVTALRTVEERRLEVAARAMPDESISVLVRDSGPGVPPEIQERLFKPLTTCAGSERGSKSGGAGGHGLGLAVCKLLLDRAGGSIALETNPRSGAAFRVRIPIKDRTQAAPRRAA